VPSVLQKKEMALELQPTMTGNRPGHAFC
jgi:hypothetical protein